MATTITTATSYIILTTERFAPPGKVNIQAVGRDGKPVDSLDKAMWYRDWVSARRDADRIGSAWLTTIVPIVMGEGLPVPAWEAGEGEADGVSVDQQDRQQ